MNVLAKMAGSGGHNNCRAWIDTRPAHSRVLVLSAGMVHSRPLVLSDAIVHSSHLVLSVNLVHSVLLVLSSWMVHSAYLVLSMPLVYFIGQFGGASRSMWPMCSIT